MKSEIKNELESAAKEIEALRLKMARLIGKALAAQEATASDFFDMAEARLEDLGCELELRLTAIRQAEQDERRWAISEARLLALVD